MNYNYDDERPDGYPSNGETPEPSSVTEEYVAHIPEPSEIPEIAGIAEDRPSNSQPWRDPSYSSVPEQGPIVYSPGIAQPAYQPRHRPEQRDERRDEHRESGGRRRGGFLRAACLVLVCAIASAASTLGVLEYRSDNADSAPPTEQTQSAGEQDTRPSKLPGTEVTDPDPGTSVQTTPGVVTQPMINPGMVLSAQEIYEMACQQVVVIKTNVATQGGYFSPGGSSVISGSGFIIREDGYIVTNYHVVEAAYRSSSSEMTVTLNNGETYPATIIGVEPGSDIAVIKIDAAGLVPVAVGDSSAMRVGETVYAVGNPLGELVYTITDGIISALDREITVESTTMNMFQISAAVNSGNSGGPVYDTYGSVIGVVTAKFSNSAVEGIGFAIPINDAMRIAAQLMENGYIVDSKAYLGLVPQTVDSTTAEFYDWVVGAYVRSVEPGSCAEKAGIQVGDIITQVGSIPVTSRESLLYAKKCFNAGDTTEIVVRRAGEDITLTITFDEEPVTQET